MARQESRQQLKRDVFRYVQIRIQLVPARTATEHLPITVRLSHVNEFKDIGVGVRLMTWSPERIIAALAEYVGRDVQDGWYEGDEWCCAARDYCHAMYYVDGCRSVILDEYCDRC